MLQLNQLSVRVNIFLRAFLAVLILTGISLATFSPRATQAAQPFADPAFNNVWNRTDKQVASGATSRSFLWGPEPFTTAVQEDYVEAPGSKRLVQYFDKSRMEITNPKGDKNSVYYVTNGLKARELMSGMLQLGDNKFEARTPSQIGVAGDADDTDGPTYAVMGKAIIDSTSQVGGPVIFASNRAGTNSDAAPQFGKYNVTYAYFEGTTKHNVARPFWDYLNQTVPVLDTAGNTVNGRLFDPVFYATGLPITEAYWARVKVGGQVKDVLEQCFERRCLTYTPANSPAYQVEMGNVGRHYNEWRYKLSQPVGQPPAETPPAPIKFAGGVGSITTPSFTLHRGMAKLKINAQKPVGVIADNVVIKSINTDTNKPSGIILTVGNPVENATFIQYIYADGNYVLQITSAGTWNIEIQDWNSYKLETPLGPNVKLNGIYDTAFKMDLPSDGTLNIHAQYNSYYKSSDIGLFILKYYASNSGVANYLIYEIKNNVVDKFASVKLKAGTYYFQVADFFAFPGIPPSWNLNTSFSPGS